MRDALYQEELNLTYLKLPVNTFITLMWNPNDRKDKSKEAFFSFLMRSFC